MSVNNTNTLSLDLQASEHISLGIDQGDRQMKLCTFVADITPAIGEALCDGLCPPVSSIEHPLLAKGVILKENGKTWILCALDWAALCNNAYIVFKEKIAEAAGTSPSCVAVQCVHQHTAPAINPNARQLMDKTKNPVPMTSAELLENASQAVAKAVRQAAESPKNVTHIGGGWAPVDQVASSRRVRQPDGTIMTRFSAATGIQQKAPEGCIDGFLRTVAFFDGEAPIAHLHYYATHPQSYWGDGRVTYDVAGIARERLEKETGVHQVYFNGCGGNITMGKYNDGKPETRPVLADRLFHGMKNSIAGVKRSPVSPIEWQSIPFSFPMCSGAAFSKKTNIDILHDTKADKDARLSAAMLLVMIERVESGSSFELSCLSIGSIHILHLPGEPFVEYQLWAQEHLPGSFVAVAGYGDCAMWYICTDKAYTDVGGYEQTWAYAGPCEIQLKSAMAKLLDKNGGVPLF